MNNKRTTVFVTFLLAFTSIWADIPNGFYSNANGKSGAALKTALYSILSSKCTEPTYNGVWNAFKTTDNRSSSYVWDIYSNATNYTLIDDQCGNYKKEGDCYNREHSFPKSWLNISDNTPPPGPGTNLFHLYPTDGFVNSKRGDLPFGEVGTVTYSSANSFSKVGKAVPRINYTGSSNVFEPNDEYKGDLARSYFYMVTRYQDLLKDWACDMLVVPTDNYQAFSTWALTMLLRWAKEDPVSDKEIARNEAIYKIQKDRNPFIDYPGLEQYVWGDLRTTAVDLNNYVDPNSGTIIVSAPIFSPAGGTYTTAQTVSISCGTSGAAIYYTTDGSTPSSSSTPYAGAITISKTTTIKAIAIKDGTNSSVSSATYTISSGGGSQGKGDFKLVTSANQLVAGYEYILVYNKGDNSKVAGSSTGEYLTPLDGAVSGNTISAPDGASVLTLGGSSGAWTFYSSDAIGYLYSSKAKSLTFGSTATKWTITGANSGYYVTNSSVGTIRYNISAPRFTNYTSDATNQLVNALLFFRVPIAGDTNTDGSVNISDVTTLVDYILNKNPNPCDANACDVNNDGMVNIADVTALVDIILQK